MVSGKQRILSIMCDESGDFGSYDHHSPYYILSFVLHDQDVSIYEQIGHLEQALTQNGYSKDHAIHTAPLIRREAPYASEDPLTRRKLFDSLFSFFRHCGVGFMSLVIEKRKFGSGEELSERIAIELGRMIRSNLEFFQQFDRTIVYYDKGQKEVTKILKLIFLANLNEVEFRVVSPEGYKLFQVADLICTLELMEAKRRDSGLSRSEVEFFRNAKRLKKTYIEAMEQKRL